MDVLKINGDNDDDDDDCLSVSIEFLNSCLLVVTYYYEYFIVIRL